MSYGYAKADNEASGIVGYSRAIYINGSRSRSLSLVRNAGNIVLRYTPRRDVRANKYSYDLITYYPNDRKFKINIDDLPISANLVRILNDYILPNFNAVLRGNTILINGFYYLGTSYGANPSLLWSVREYGGYSVDEDPDQTYSDSQDEDTGSYIPEPEKEPEFDPAQEIALAREKAGFPAPDDLPDTLAWVNDALVAPFAIPIIEVTEWTYSDTVVKGWKRDSSRYLKNKSDFDLWLGQYQDRAINIIHNTEVRNTSQNKVLAVYSREE